MIAPASVQSALQRDSGQQFNCPNMIGQMHGYQRDGVLADSGVLMRGVLHCARHPIAKSTVGGDAVRRRRSVGKHDVSGALPESGAAREGRNWRDVSARHRCRIPGSPPRVSRRPGTGLGL